ncbi:DNA-cytosine methyltransferase [Clostridium cellulovorans 743B]|uniref:DNA (cytosine-5-)-methyltransferase n=1 Tax=Clostridium cellulovorans (strain ATCC 35296 / DSM 3052 / OCM 3 / 743B) TaxID=573061 RepID=D9SSE6_CLOC7|nr:DNA (cytosine-5-)-methyltransferase [Clostridium cellulovorans]ADL50543.1 DNA-cytosine methyltransferase [Clostridium cellulovorans 743B]
MISMTFLDFCAGIGGFRLGLELTGHKCIGFCEKDKFAVKSYKAMFETEGEWYANDITELKSDEIPYADIWCFGFPCQDISVAGKQRGIRGKRSGIYFRIIDLIKGKEEKAKPTYLLIENVKNLLSINNGFDFATVLLELDQAGYDARWQVLNSKDFGVPQNRERVFIIASLRSRGRREILPIGGENRATLKQIIGVCQGERVYDSEGVACTLTGCGGGGGAKTGLYCVGNINPSGNGMNGNVYSAEGIAPTVTVNKGQGSKIFIDQSNTKPQLTDISRCITSRYTGGVVNRTAMNSAVLEAYPVLTPERVDKRQNGRRMKEYNEPMFTLTSQDRHGIAIKNATKKGYVEANIGDGIYLNFPNSTTRRGRVGKGVVGTLDTACAVGTLDRNYRIRRLTPKECFRLQGFPDELFEKAKAVNSDAQLYKQAGNAVTVNVAYAVAKSLPISE